MDEEVVQKLEQLLLTGLGEATGKSQTPDGAELMGPPASEEELFSGVNLDGDPVDIDYSEITKLYRKRY